MFSRICLSRFFALVALLLGPSACGGSSAFNDKDYNPDVIRPFNHTLSYIVWARVNGIGVSGETCCVMLPVKWHPGMKVNAEWEIDPNPFEELKRTPGGGATDPDAWKAHQAKFQRFKATADIPEYPDNKTCGLQVHFLNCGQIKVTAVCIPYKDPRYPIQDPFEVPVAKTCPNTASAQ